MSSIPNLADELVENLNNNTPPKEATFVETYTSISTYSDTHVKPNLEQMMLDVFSAGYDFNSDGVATYATPLEDQMVKNDVDEDITGAKTFTNDTAFEAPVTSTSTFSSTLQHRCRVYMTSSQSIADLTPTQLTFHAEAYDKGGLFSPSAANIIIPSGGDGAYRFGAQVNFAANATGVRRVYIYKDGAEVARVSATDADGTETTFMQVEFIDEAVAGNQYSVYVYQSSGGALNVLGNAGGTQSFFHAQKVW